MNIRRMLEQGSGFAGTITTTNKLNTQANQKIVNIGKTATEVTLTMGKMGFVVGCVGGILVGVILSITSGGWVAGSICFSVGAAGGFVAGGVIGFSINTAIGAVAGVTKGIIENSMAIYKHRNDFFNYEKPMDLVSGLITVGTSAPVLLIFALEQTIKFLGYMICALGNLLMCKKDSYLNNGSLAADAFIKIFENLIAAIFNPVINFVDWAGKVVSGLGHGLGCLPFNTLAPQGMFLQAISFPEDLPEETSYQLA